MKSVKFLQIFVQLQPLLPLLLQNTKLKRLNGKKERENKMNCFFLTEKAIGIKLLKIYLSFSKENAAIVETVKDQSSVILVTLFCVMSVMLVFTLNILHMTEGLYRMKS